MSKTVTVPSEATDEWARLFLKACKMCTWDEAFAAKLISAVLSTAPAVEPDGGEVERVARAIDPGAWEDDGPIPTRKDTVTFHERRQRSAALARAAIAAMSSGAVKVKKLREALTDAEETLRLVEHPARVDPVHGPEIDALGRRIGYGALMSSASASWRAKMLADGLPVGGEFVAGPCQGTVAMCLAKIRSALQETDHG